MMSLTLIGGCLVGLLLLAVFGAAIVFLVVSARRDTVSTARNDWIQRRSEGDEQGW